MMRNPKDQAVSWYHFSKTQPYAGFPSYKHMYTADKKKFFDSYFAGLQCYVLEDNFCEAKPKAKLFYLNISLHIGEHKLFAKKGEGYLEHLKEWYPHQNDSNVLFAFYEDLKKVRAMDLVYVRIVQKQPLFESFESDLYLASILNRI